MADRAPLDQTREMAPDTLSALRAKLQSADEWAVSKEIVLLLIDTAEAAERRATEAEQDARRITDAYADSLARIEALTEALRQVVIAAALPLEALNADNYAGAKWMAPSVRDAVEKACDVLRAAARVVAETQEGK